MLRPPLHGKEPPQFLMSMPALDGVQIHVQPVDYRNEVLLLGPVCGCSRPDETCVSNVKLVQIWGPDM